MERVRELLANGADLSTVLAVAQQNGFDASELSDADLEIVAGGKQKKSSGGSGSGCSTCG